ncbi:hypothetical protein Bca4012_038920 [Brassica carinata]
MDGSYVYQATLISPSYLNKRLSTPNLNSPSSISLSPSKKRAFCLQVVTVPSPASRRNSRKFEAFFYV